MAERGRDPPLELPLVDLSARPDFATKAGRILDLYEGRWEGELLEPGDFVVCVDEKPSIPPRARKHPRQPAKPGAVRCGQLVAHEYERKGSLRCLATWEVRRARLFDRCAPKDGIEPFDRLVEQFVTLEPHSKVPQPSNVPDLDTLEQTLLAFGRHTSTSDSNASTNPNPNSSSPPDRQIRQRTWEDDHPKPAPPGRPHLAGRDDAE